MNMILVDGQITKNFNIYEMRCKDNNEIMVNLEAIEHIKRLQKFRDWYKRPMSINSGYRTTAYNKKIGGSPKSQHVKGLASDIALPPDYYKADKKRKQEMLDNMKNKWYELCKADGVKGGVGFYNTFIHLDSRTSQQSFWDYRK